MLIFIDDATLSKQAIFDTDFYGMLSIARHMGISFIINFHSLSSARVLSPFVRQNNDYLCLYKVVSEGLLRMIFDEYLSLANVGDWNTFKEQYRNHTNSGTFKSVLLNARTGDVDWNLRELVKSIQHSSGGKGKAASST